MPDYFSQYGGIAGNIADQYGIPQPVFFGLVQQESSWNPFAQASTSSAHGFTQLVRGTATQMGVTNINDPIQQLQGGAKYLASMPGSNWTEKLAHYFQGPGATLNSSGFAYANGVLDKAKKFLKGGDLSSIVGDATKAGACTAGDPMACLSLLSGGGDGDGCGTFDFVCKLRNWITQSSFFVRLALALVALLFILGGLYLMKGKE